MRVGGVERSRRMVMGQGALILTLAIANVGWNTDLDAPPRFDGAGYAVLAESLREGRGYRAIDHPDAPRHAHFPPGYPIALALLWLVGGPSERSAHVFSMVCTVAAALLAWLWFRRLERPGIALTLGAALAVNWTWGRQGGAIQSEPLFLLLQMIVVLATGWVGRGRRSQAIGRPVSLGLLLGVTTLTRHVGVMLAVASGLALMLRRRWKAALVAGITTALVLAPWGLWLVWVGRGTQVALLPRSGLMELVASQALFYLRRLPDQISGPVVEVGTVFRPALAGPVTVWAALATALTVWGWFRCLRSSRKRLAGLAPLAMLALLLVWPFTEAGRFLLPVVPFVIVGAFEGTTAGLVRLGIRRRRAGAWAAGFLLLLSLPYSTYAVLSDRSAASQARNADFDAACEWIARQGDHPGPLLTRQPGEAFWRTGRTALPPPNDLDAIERLVDRFDVAYLILDEDRYARSPTSPLTRFVARSPDRFEEVWSQGGTTILEVRDPRELTRPEPSAARD